MTGLDLPRAVLPGQLVHDHRLAAHPAGGIDDALDTIDLALALGDQKPAIDGLRYVKKLMCDNLGSVADAGRCRDCHLELLWRARAKARFLRSQHVTGDRNTNRLTRQIDDHRQCLALARREQPRCHVSGHQPDNLRLAWAGVYGRHFNHQKPALLKVQQVSCH